MAHHGNRQRPHLKNAAPCPNKPGHLCAPVRLPPDPSPKATLKPRPPTERVSPVTRVSFPACCARYPRRIEWVRPSISSPSVLSSSFCGRVGIRIPTFEACSGFSHVTARRIAQPPKAAFVTRLRSSQLPGQNARQRPEQSTILWVDPPSTGYTRLRGAPQNRRYYRAMGSAWESGVPSARCKSSSARRA